MFNCDVFYSFKKKYFYFLIKEEKNDYENLRERDSSKYCYLFRSNIQGNSVKMSASDAQYLLQ
jgi:hypothetical protein